MCSMRFTLCLLCTVHIVFIVYGGINIVWLTQSTGALQFMCLIEITLCVQLSLSVCVYSRQHTAARPTLVNPVSPVTTDSSLLPATMLPRNLHQWGCHLQHHHTSPSNASQVLWLLTAGRLCVSGGGRDGCEVVGVVEQAQWGDAVGMTDIGLLISILCRSLPHFVIGLMSVTLHY